MSHKQSQKNGMESTEKRHRSKQSPLSAAQAREGTPPRRSAVQGDCSCTQTNAQTQKWYRAGRAEARPVGHFRRGQTKYMPAGLAAASLAVNTYKQTHVRCSTSPS